VPILKREADAFPETLFQVEHPWWVAHLRSRQEKRFARYLRERRVPFYLPQMEKRSRRNGRTVISYLPLFGGYVFFRGAPRDAATATRSHLIANLLEPVDQAELDSELFQLHSLQVNCQKLVPYPYVGKGDVACVTEGAFKGLRGQVIRERGSERLVLSITFIRQSVTVEIDRDLVAPHRAAEVLQAAW
jgi:transcription antitermination factor NusG